MIAAAIDKASFVVSSLFAPPDADARQFSIKGLLKLTFFASISFAVWPYFKTISLAFGFYFVAYLLMLFSDMVDNRPIDDRSRISRALNGGGLFFIVISFLLFALGLFVVFLSLWVYLASTRPLAAG